MAGSAPPPASREPRRTWTSALPLSLFMSVVALAAGVAAAAPTLPGDAREARRLDSSLTRIAELSQGRLRPTARRLAEELPVGAERLEGLREPARTTQDQAEIALDELRQMGLPATLDPHYAPALVAAGRAFVAASGQDPLTRTTIDPGYTGLESGLAAGEAQLTAEAETAAKLSSRIGRLSQALERARRRGHRLAQLLRRGSAPPRGR